MRCEHEASVRPEFATRRHRLAPSVPTLPDDSKSPLPPRPSSIAAWPACPSAKKPSSSLPRLPAYSPRIRIDDRPPVRPRIPLPPRDRASSPSLLLCRFGLLPLNGGGEDAGGDLEAAGGKSSRVTGTGRRTGLVWEQGNSRGQILGITSVSLLPVKSLDDLSVTVLWGFLEALASALCMNIYVVGLNQLFDIEIDKVNKPNLPLASGEFSVATGVLLVVAFLAMSISIGVRSKSAPLMCALLVSFLLGSAYSIDVPLLRWKRHPFLAAFCILVVRAILVQLAFFTHMQQHILKRPFMPTRSVVFATFFMCCFSAVIALFKDIPDVDGDRDFGIQSLSVRLGQHKVYGLCINILMAAYAAAILVGASSANLYQKIATLFYAEYFLIPFV
nr:unnamed protein product [Digitaria exilis]